MKTHANQTHRFTRRADRDERGEIWNFDVSPDNAAPVADAGGPYSIRR